MNLQETLSKISKYREIAEAQKAKGETPAISERTFNLMEKMALNLNGRYDKGRASLQEALTTTDTVQLIPKILEGKMRHASEMEYLGTRFFNTITVEGGSSAVYVIPVVGELYASEITEGGRYKEQNVDYNTIENSTLEVRVKKIGTRVAITEEAISDSSWDILGINVEKIGRSMARYKEEWIFNEFTKSGHTVFNNNLRSQNAASGTTGKNSQGEYNDTLSVEDFLDMALTMMSNGFNPTDVIMHPLCWVVFARNSMIGNGLSYGFSNEKAAA